MPSEALAFEHRAALTSLSGLTEDNLRALFASLAGASPDEIRDALMEVVPMLAETYGDMASALAMDFYESVREEADVRRGFSAEPAALPGSARYEALVRWGVDPLFHPDAHDLSGTTATGLALSLLDGGLQKIVSNVSRETVVLNSDRDPAAAGWRRIARPDGCRFCRMLAARGAVYKRSGVRFASHDGCHCSAAPAFGSGREASVMQYKASARRSSDPEVQAARNATLREYLAENFAD
jgi:hypothetical protein